MKVFSQRVDEVVFLLEIVLIQSPQFNILTVAAFYKTVPVGMTTSQFHLSSCASRLILITFKLLPIVVRCRK